MKLTFNLTLPTRTCFITEIHIHSSFFEGGQIESRDKLSLSLEEERKLVNQERKIIAPDKPTKNDRLLQQQSMVLASPDLSAMQKAVLMAIIENPRITRKALAQQFEIHESAVQKHINALKNKKAIVRMGSTRGYWKTKKYKL